MYVDHEFTMAVITVIFALCRDFRQLPWFCVTAVIITEICTISTSKRSICLNICVVFLSWAPVVSSLTLLHGREYVHTERWPHARLHSSFFDQTDSDTASDTGACDREHAVGQPAAAHPIAREKRPQCQAVNKELTHRSGSVMKTQSRRYCRRVGGFRSKRLMAYGKTCGSIAPT